MKLSKQQLRELALFTYIAAAVLLALICICNGRL